MTSAAPDAYKLYEIPVVLARVPVNFPVFLLSCLIVYRLLECLPLLHHSRLLYSTIVPSGGGGGNPASREEWRSLPYIQR